MSTVTDRVEAILSAAGELLREASLLRDELREQEEEEPDPEPPAPPTGAALVAHALIAGTTWADPRGVDVDGVVSGTKRKIRPGSQAVKDQWVAAVTAVGGTVAESSTSTLVAEVPGAWAFRLDALPVELDSSAAAREWFAVGVIHGEGSTAGLVLDDPDPAHRAAFRALLLSMGVSTTEERQKVHAHEGDWPTVQGWPFASWGRVPGGEPTTTPDPVPDPPSSGPVPISGLLWREYPTGVKAAWIWDHCDGIVLSYDWATLDTAPGVTALRSDLDDIADRGKRALLRVSTGAGAPDRLRTMAWATNKGKGDQSTVTTIQIAPYWTDEVRAEVDALMVNLAATVGDHPALAGVAVPMGTQFSEPLLGQWAFGDNLRNAIDTGWTPAMRDDRVIELVGDLRATFPGQYVYLPLNPPGTFDLTTKTYRPGNAAAALALAGRVLAAHDAVVLGNNSWSVVSEWSAESTVLYPGIKALADQHSGHFGFQTETAMKSADVGILPGLDAAVAFGAISIELPRGAEAELSDADVTALREGLHTNLGG